MSIAPARMAKVGTVDPAYVSYNVEMVEVTGGSFWRPYSANAETHPDTKVTPTDAPWQRGVDASLYQYRAPTDLANSRLRNLAKGMRPAYVRVSGTWANTTYFQDNDQLPLKQPPEGFDGVLTRAQWKAVMDFAHAVGAQIVTSFAISAGTRGSDGVWTPAQARALIDYTRASGGRLAAAEFVNEPTLAMLHGAPQGYDAAAFARDITIFRTLLREEAPDILLIGPGGVGEGRSVALPTWIIHAEDMMKATGPIYDVFSYHFYGTTSSRCVALGRGRGVTIDQVLSPEWLDRTERVEAFYAGLRDTYLPGKPIWLTETAESACGGDTFAAQFADTFRFVNQLGALALKGVQVVMHNTLAASDYGLIDQETLIPRPNYWAAVLWKAIMGTTVLDPGTPRDGVVRIYAHCMRQKRGGVALVAINIDNEEHLLALPVSGERFTLTAPDLASTRVLLNDSSMRAQADGSFSPIRGQVFEAGTVRLPPRSISFLTTPSARNSSCN